MQVRKVDAGFFYLTDEDSTWRAGYYVDPIRPADGTPPTEAVVRAAADDHVVAGPFDLDSAIKRSAELNRNGK